MAARLGLEPRLILVVTLHRPALVDGELLNRAMTHLQDVSAQLPIVFPVHPRTRAVLEATGSFDGNLSLLEPMGYLEFLSLVKDSAAVLTDSGGIQEETTFLGVPCFTLRANTERPVTVEREQTDSWDWRRTESQRSPHSSPRGFSRSTVPKFWDGRAAERVVAVLREHLQTST